MPVGCAKSFSIYLFFILKVVLVLDVFSGENLSTTLSFFFRYLIQDFFCLVKRRDMDLLTESKQERFVRSFRFVPAFEIFCCLDSEIVTSVIGLWKFCFCFVSWFRKASYGIVTVYFVKTL